MKKLTACLSLTAVLCQPLAAEAGRRHSNWSGKNNLDLVRNARKAEKWRSKHYKEPAPFVPTVPHKLPQNVTGFMLYSLLLSQTLIHVAHSANQVGRSTIKQYPKTSAGAFQDRSVPIVPTNSTKGPVESSPTSSFFAQAQEIPVAPQLMPNPIDLRTHVPVTNTSQVALQQRDFATCSLLSPSEPLTGKTLDYYQSLSAQQKEKILLDRMNENVYAEDQLPQGGSGMAMGNLLNPCYLAKAFTYESDEMPAGRHHIIHVHGSGGAAEFISESSVYSGIFASGDPNVIVRFSLAAPVDKPEDSRVPGVAVKFLVNGKPSQNVVAIYSLDGQGPNANIFENEFATALPPPSSMVLKVGSFFFKMGTWLLGSSAPVNERTLPLDKVAHVEADGTPVAKEDLRYPEKLIFEPADDVKKMIDPKDTADPRIRLAQIPKGTMLYRLYGSDLAAGSKRHYIGYLRLKENLVASPGVDNLFFQHQTRSGD